MEKLDVAWYLQHHLDDPIGSLQCYDCRNKKRQFLGPLLQPEVKQGRLNAGTGKNKIELLHSYTTLLLCYLFFRDMQNITSTYLEI
jgi:hypothetical protein